MSKRFKPRSGQADKRTIFSGLTAARDVLCGWMGGGRKGSLRPGDGHKKACSQGADGHTGQQSEKKLITALYEKTQDKKLKRLLRAYVRNELDSQRFTFALNLYDSGTYLEDLCATRANATFLEDPEFQRAYQAGASVSTWQRGIRWRVYNLIKLAGVALQREGDFVECGVDRGGMSLALLTFYGQKLSDRRFWLFDTFQGLVDTQMNEVEQEKNLFGKERYPDVYAQVRDTFSPFENVRIIRGAIPDTLDQYSGHEVAYLHIDMNVAYPEVKALDFFWPRISPGGVVVLDDYGFPRRTEQKKAMDACAQRLDTEIILMPTGQGLIIK